MNTRLPSWSDITAACLNAFSSMHSTVPWPFVQPNDWKSLMKSGSPLQPPLPPVSRGMGHLLERKATAVPTANQWHVVCRKTRQCWSTPSPSEVPPKRCAHNQQVDTHRCNDNAPVHRDLWAQRPMPPRLRSFATLNLSNNARWDGHSQLRSRQPQQARTMEFN